MNTAIALLWRRTLWRWPLTCRFCLLVGILFLVPQAQAASRVWVGGSTNDNWSSPDNWTNGVVPTAGDDLIFPLGAGRLSSANNFPNGTVFDSITISGTNYTFTGSTILLNAGINASNTIAQSYFNIPLVLNSNQTIMTGNMGVNLYVQGAIDTNGKDLTFAGNGVAQLSSIVSGSGGLIKVGTGSLLMYASNTFSGTVQIAQGTVNIYNANALGATNGSTVISNGALLNLISSTFTPIPEPFVLSGSLTAATPPKTLTGPITLTASNATIAATTSLVITNIISGNGGFTKTSTDVLTLNANNTYTGTTTIDQGTVVINGSQPASPIILSGAAVSTLQGTGTVATVTAVGNATKTLAPGGVGAPGILSCSNVTLSSSTTFKIRLNGPAPGSGYDQLKVNGSVTLSNASLIVTTNYMPAIGQSFVIIKHLGAGTTAGTFNGLPEAATYTGGGLPLRISYVGGAGSDVTLTMISPPTRFNSIARLTNGQVQLRATGALSGYSYSILAATNLNPAIQWSNIGSAIADSSGVISFTDTNAPLFPTRFYRALSP